ncbi:hypothetical protein KIPB_006595 [Kipferlia bialata]|uniref:Uncharacterized protein n=1 Tax=Kipferlia bialata TaxID=797122 RepID=A0A9K3CX86_9EUKA|nr:hypothetical protein KIPB_006595 [Kipferlia bialata]|eukprot:g6595.t1
MGMGAGTRVASFMLGTVSRSRLSPAILGRVNVRFLNSVCLSLSGGGWLDSMSVKLTRHPSALIPCCILFLVSVLPVVLVRRSAVLGVSVMLQALSIVTESMAALHSYSGVQSAARAIAKLGGAVYTAIVALYFVDIERDEESVVVTRLCMATVCYGVLRLGVALALTLRGYIRHHRETEREKELAGERVSLAVAARRIYWPGDGVADGYRTLKAKYRAESVSSAVSCGLDFVRDWSQAAVAGLLPDTQLGVQSLAESLLSVVPTCVLRPIEVRAFKHAARGEGVGGASEASSPVEGESVSDVCQAKGVEREGGVESPSPTSSETKTPDVSQEAQDPIPPSTPTASPPCPILGMAVSREISYLALSLAVCLPGPLSLLMGDTWHEAGLALMLRYELAHMCLYALNGTVESYAWGACRGSTAVHLSGRLTACTLAGAALRLGLASRLGVVGAQAAKCVETVVRLVVNLVTLRMAPATVLGKGYGVRVGVAVAGHALLSLSAPPVSLGTGFSGGLVSRVLAIILHNPLHVLVGCALLVWQGVTILRHTQRGNEGVTAEADTHVAASVPVVREAVADTVVSS